MERSYGFFVKIIKFLMTYLVNRYASTQRLNMSQDKITC